MIKPNVIKNYQEYFVETAEQRILEVLFRIPDKEFSLSDLAKLSKTAKANIGKILNKLEKREILEIERLSKIWRIRANRQNSIFKNLKRIYNLSFIYQSGIIEFLNEYYSRPKSIILFGSFRKGEDISTSDIDIAIETSEDIDIETFDITDQFTEWAHKDWKLFFKLRKIQILKFNRGRIDINLFNNVANGFVLYGFLEVKP